MRALWILILTVMASIPALSAPTEEEILDQVTRGQGQIVDAKRYPQLHKRLQDRFVRLAKAQEELADGAVVSLNKLYIVESSEPNAFVVALKETGVRVSNNLVFVTTALIDRMINFEPETHGKASPLAELEIETELKEGLDRLSGVMAHELGHPMDSIEEYKGHVSIENHYGQAGSQAQEIRADIDGTRILRRAGIKVTSLYEGLKRLFGLDGRQGLLASFLSTHPQADFRLTSLRLFLTLSRLSSGFQKDVLKESIDHSATVAIQHELADIKEHIQQPKYVRAKSFHEISELISSIYKRIDWLHTELRETEFNRLVLSMDLLLEEKEKRGEALTETEWNELFEILREVVKSEEELASYSEQLPTLDPEKSKPDFAKARSHWSYLETLKIYADPKFIARAKELLESLREKPTYQEGAFIFEEAAKILNSKVVIDLYGDELVFHLRDQMAKGETYYSTYFTTRGALKKSARLRLRALGLLNERLLPSIENDAGLWYFRRLALDEMPLPFGNYDPVKKKFKNFELTKQIRQLRVLARAKNPDPEVVEINQKIEEHFKRLWNGRAYFALLEVLARQQLMNWELVAEVVGVDYKVAIGQIERSVRDYTAGRLSLKAMGLPDYPELLEHMSLSAHELLKLKSYSFYDGRYSLVWASKENSDFISGQNNPAIQGKEALSQVARDAVLSEYLARQDGERSRKYQKTFQAVASEVSWPEDMSSKSIVSRMWSAHLKTLERIGLLRATQERFELYMLAQLEMASQLPLSAAQKRAWLEALFLPAEPREDSKVIPPANYDWLLSEGQEFGEAAIQGLIREGVVRSASDFLLRVRQLKSFTLATDKNQGTSYYSVLRNLSRLLLAEFESLKPEALTPQRLLELTALLTKRSGRTERDASTVPSIQNLRVSLVRVAEKMNLAPREKLEFFLRVSAFGPTRETDTYFEAQVRPLLEKKSELRHLESLLQSQRIFGGPLQLQLTKLVFEGRLKELERHKPVARRDVFNLIQDLNRFVTESSMEKDKYIESFAWRLGLKGTELDGLIEDQKGQNWQKANPLLVNAGSLISSEVSRMNPARRRELLRYLIDPSKFELGLPESVVKEFERVALTEIMKAPVDPNRNVKAEAREKALAMKLKVEKMLRDSSPKERIPLLENVLTAGAHAMMREKGWPHNITREFLGYEEGDLSEKMLEAYLAIVPEVERGATVAYLLSQSGREKGSVADIFEVFGTVGIKFGQLASIWEIFGPQVARETKHLKDRATGMTKYEFLKNLEHYQRGVYEDVDDVVKILGSASIKTVALVRMKSGKMVVMAMRASHAEEKIESNLALGEAFLTQLEKFNLEKKSALMGLLLKALREQLKEEIQFDQEVVKIERARKVFEALTGELKSEMKGWSVEVPEVDSSVPVKDMMFGMSEAKGVTFDQLTVEQRAEVGEVLMKLSVASLFRQGWFDPDRHKGNWLIDPVTKKIYCLDLGQLEPFDKSPAPWKWDPRLTLASFAQAIKDKNPEAVLQAALLMSQEKPASRFDASRVKSKLAQVFAEQDKALRELRGGKGLTREDFDEHRTKIATDVLVGTVTALAEGGVPLDKRFLFGALKGLMVLAGERYVSAEKFEEILAGEAKRLAMRKLPALAWAQAKARFAYKSAASSESIKGTGGRVRCEALFGG